MALHPEASDVPWRLLPSAGQPFLDGSLVHPCGSPVTIDTTEDLFVAGLKHVYYTE